MVQMLLSFWCTFILMICYVLYHIILLLRGKIKTYITFIMINNTTAPTCHISQQVFLSCFDWLYSRCFNDVFYLNKCGLINRRVGTFALDYIIGQHLLTYRMLSVIYLFFFFISYIFFILMKVLFTFFSGARDQDPDIAY
jgi:hypothetical protein